MNSSSWISLILKNKATYALGLINILVFVSYGFSGIDTILLLDLGANFSPYTLTSEPHRLFTSMFLHGHFFHLAANMYSLYALGQQAEERFGTFHFLAIYFITGLLASMASLHFNLFGISVGASGAIFGVYGYLLVDVLLHNRQDRIQVILNFVVYLVLMMVLGSHLQFDNAGHLGGVASGMVLGWIHHYSRSVGTYAGALVLIAFSYVALPRHQAEYFRAFQLFIHADSTLTGHFNAQISDEALLEALLKVKSLPDSAISAFRTISYIPPDLQQDTLHIMSCLQIRSNQLGYFVKGLSRESFIYLDSIVQEGQRLAQLPPLAYPLGMRRPAPKPDSTLQPAKDLRFVQQFYDENWFESSAYHYAYYRLGQKDSLGDWHGNVQDFYADSTIQMKGTYTRGLKQGIFLYYSQDSAYEAAGRYFGDNKVGKWEYYHPNGQLASEIRHEEGFARIINVWDSLGNVLVANGTGEEVHRHPNGVVSLRRSIRDGLNDGFTVSYYENGTLRYREYFEDGFLIKGVSYSENGQNTYDGSTYLCYPDGGFEAFYQNYLESANQMKSDTVDASVVLRFDVHPSGQIHDIRFLKRYRPEYDEYARQLLLDGPNWNPAKAHGLMEINSSAEVTITF